MQSLTQTAVQETRNAVWARLRFEAAAGAAEEPMLASALHAAVLSHADLSEGLAYVLGQKLGGDDVNALQAQAVCREVYAQSPNIIDAAIADLEAVSERDPACRNLLQPFMHFKGFHALQGYRVAHALWGAGREGLADHLQARISARFQVDIHPAARIGRGVMIDHATSVVIGETAVVGDDCSILHEVTLGGTGVDTGDRHPKVGAGVLIGAGAKVLGNITIGDGARIAAGSVVLSPVEPACTVAGVPARPIGGRCCEPARNMDHTQIYGGGPGEGA